MTPLPGRLITFEGIEGVGKSTQVEAARTRLLREGLRVETTREPGGTPLAERLRAIVLEPGHEPVGAAAELLIMAAARAQHTAGRLRPLLEQGVVVLCDRYLDASYAYQGAGRGIGDAEIDAVTRLATGGLVPDLTVLLDAPPSLALGRARARSGPADRIEAEALAFFERARAKYLARARAEPDRFRVIDATLEPTVVASKIAAELGRLLGRSLA